MKFSTRNLWLSVLLLAGTAAAHGQTVLEQVLDPVENSAGSSMSYRFEPQTYTPAPEGYVPFYISHFGRHGSRYHTTENIYRKFYDIFAAAAANNALTPFGMEVKQRVDTIFAVCDGHAGVLTPAGEREHREIAARMYRNYPEVFQPKGKRRKMQVFSRSTSVGRVIQSMRSFDGALKMCEPELDIREESGGVYNGYLNHYTKAYKDYYKDGEWRAVYDAKRGSWFSPDRFVESLFCDADYVKRHISSRRSFMMEFFAVASILQDCPLDVSLYDVFTDDEIFALWRLQNLSQYLRKGPSAIAGELAASIAKPLLRDMLACAEEAVAGGSVVADLRFGHGEGLMPLAALMRLEGACGVESDPEKVENVWNDFRITPMAGNIQLIFYRNAKGRVLVKFLLNEREVTVPVAGDTAPYYDWKAVRKYYYRIAKE